MVAKPGPYGPNIVKRKNTLYATLMVPKDVREKLGRVRYITTLETDSVTEAQRKAPRLVEAWKLEIAKARGLPTNQVEKDAAWFRAALSRSVGDAALRQSLLDQVEDIATEMAPTSEFGSDQDASAEEIQEAVKFHQQATGADTAAALEDWLSTLDDTAKTLDMKRSDVLRLAKEFPSVLLVTPVEVNKYVLRLRAGGVGADGQTVKGLAPATLKKALSTWRGYWRYLQATGVTDDGPEVFKVLLPKASKKNGDDRLPFPVEAIPTLLEAAEGDRDLYDLILLAAYTGARIEELCALDVSDVDLSKHTLTVIDSKTPAGNRVVPIHKELMPLMRTRVDNRSEGRLLSSLTPNKYGDYSNAIGKRFGRLKTKLGYGPLHVFHSIRKTMTTIMENAGVAENVTAAIVGHEVGTMTYGLYSGGPSLSLKAEAVAKISYP